MMRNMYLQQSCSIINIINFKLLLFIINLPYLFCLQCDLLKKADIFNNGLTKIKLNTIYNLWLELASNNNQTNCRSFISFNYIIIRPLSNNYSIKNKCLLLEKRNLILLQTLLYIFKIILILLLLLCVIIDSEKKKILF